MDLKFLILLCFLTLAINLTVGQRWRPTPRPLPTAAPVKIPTLTQCTQYGNGKDYWFTWFNSTSCYHFSSYTSESTEYVGTWQDAVDRCRSKKSSLVSIHDYYTNYVLGHPTVMPSKSYGGFYWIGRTSINSTNRGVYRWSDGTASNFLGNMSQTTTGGQKLDPNPYNQGRCISMFIYPTGSMASNYYKSKIGLWYKTECGNRANFICRKDVNPNVTPAPPPKPIPGGCPNGWYKYANQKCIKYFPNAGNFTQAQKTCVSNKGADMLSIHSQDEQDFVSAITYGQRSPYIGLSRASYYYQWKWDDQSNVNFDNFGVQEYTRASYFSNCAILVTNKTQPEMWLKVNCSDKHPVLCQIPQQDPKISTGLTLSSNKCKLSGFGNYIQFRNACYSVIDGPSAQLGFQAAEANCQGVGAHLVSIIDKYEESFLRYYLNQNGKSSQYWIGLESKPDPTVNINVSQLFEWTDDWPVFFTNWAWQEPKILKNSANMDQCVYMNKRTGNWITTTNCTNPKSYVCMVNGVKAPVINGDRTGYCPTLNDNTDPSLNWVNLHKGTPFCYWFSTERRGIKGVAGLDSYSDARFHCQRRNGTLVSIHSPVQMKLIANRLSTKVPSFSSWIGLSRNPSGDFVWEDNSPVNFLNGLPTDNLANMTNLNDDSGLLCAELKYDSTWQWASCLSQQRLYFVCQTPKLYANSSPSKSNAGKTAGTVIGVLLAIAVVAGVIYYVRRNNVKLPAMPSFENPIGRGQRTNGIKHEKFDNNSSNNLTNGTHDNPFRDEQHSQDVNN